jgi:hypothetical protein
LAVQEEESTRVKIRRDEMENVAHADVPVDASVPRAHAIADALNLAALSDASLMLADADADAEYKIVNKNITHYFLLHNYIIKNKPYSHITI